MCLHRYAIGELYSPNVTSWPETVEYNFRNGQHELLIFFADPTDAEIEAVRHGAARFALVVREPALFFCIRFGQQPWLDCAYTWHRVPEAERQVPPDIPAPQRPLVTVLLVDARTGILRVIRVLTWTPAFGQAVHRAIRAQIESSWPGNAPYERHCRDIHARYTTPQLLEQATILSDAEDDPGTLQRVDDALLFQPDAQFADVPLNDRPTRWLRLAREWYPHAWQMADDYRRERGRRLTPWPSWCYLPMAGAQAIVTRDRPLTPERGHHIAVLAALAAWRATQGIYRFDGDLLGELLETPIAGALPIEALRLGPEWCPYLLLDGRDYDGKRLRAAWVHLEYDVNSGREELRLLLDTDDDTGSHLFPAYLYLRPGATLDDALAAADQATKAKAIERGYDPDLVGAVPRTLVEPIISAYLYLCSQAAEIRHHRRLTAHPRRPPAPRDLQGPTTWDVGYHLGPALRAARSGDREAGERVGAHSSPRPHVRRAHWHAYWVGPHDQDRKLELRWLHPILVGAEAHERLVPVVRDVDPVDDTDSTPREDDHES